jgi:hypothetical protein
MRYYQLLALLHRMGLTPLQVLVDILRPFSTKDLLPLASVSHRFHLVVARLLHRRLLDVASLPQNDLILECYHPSAKISTPYLKCQYLGTNTRGGDEVGADGNEPVLADLGRLFSSFRPALAEENRRQRARYRFSDMYGPGGPVDDTATEDIYLDEGELFSQLCAVINLVRTGPRPGLFLSHVNISDGVLRVWRDWLADMEQGQTSRDGILWVDNHQGVGVRFSVTPGPADTMPIISGPDDHPPIGYKLQYEGESLSVDSRHQY